ncbi:hypothetical protein JNW88_30820 [Micromonospora sp. ATA32]|nr:hypothetical protein [Micromonospora sp. ATA32]
MVERKIIFYRWSSANARPPFLPHSVADGLAKRIADDDYAAMLEGNEITTAVHVISPGTESSPVKLRMLSLRSPDNRPLQWEPGADLAPLPLLDDQYPADVTYITIWPDGIAAQDIYTNAPRLGRLSHFLRNKMNAFVSFDPLYMPDVYERLRDLRGQLRGVSVALTRPEYADRNPGVLGTFLPAIYGPSAPSIKVEVGMGRYTPRNLYLNDEIDEAVFQIAESAHELVDRLVVRGRSRRTNQVEQLNLMTERLEDQVILPASTAAAGFPDPDATFAATVSAYDKFKQRGVFDRAVQALLMRSR